HNSNGKSLALILFLCVFSEMMEYAFNSTHITHLVYGVSANVAAMLLYGTNYVPVKRIEVGDGMFFHWVSCSAIWLVSLIGDLTLQSPKFYPLAMLGGVIWATGNIAAVPILKAVGFGLGIVIWGASSLLMGWASSRFGWFGIAASQVSRPVLNYSGAGLCLLSVLILFFVKTNAQLHPPPESTPLLFDRVSVTLQNHHTLYINVHPFLDHSHYSRLGCLLAVVSGLLYGSSLVPILYIKSHSSYRDSMFYGASVYDLDYIYAQCSGIFLASTVYFAIYCAARRNRPRVYSRAILPGLLSGLMWTLATYSWFLANRYLNPVNTFPIVSTVSTVHHGLTTQWTDFASCLTFCFGLSLLTAGSLLATLSNL
uniref:Uncharacterized protein n=1 Tax=Periophthalmus magnuspinnatus TaxID=409849 RepID=A0A3B4BEC0_9GOBI